MHSVKKALSGTDFGRSQFNTAMDAVQASAEQLPNSHQKAAVLNILERCREKLETLILAGQTDGMQFGLESLLPQMEESPTPKTMSTRISDHAITEFDALTAQAVGQLMEIWQDALPVLLRIGHVKSYARLAVSCAQLDGTTQGLSRVMNALKPPASATTAGQTDAPEDQPA